MKEILAFGDSLTWGADPATGKRHPLEGRWPSVLEKELDGLVHVVAEGLGGRTTSFDDHSAAAERNAVRSLPMLLGSHYPLDLVIIMLGTNDLKPFICGYANGANAGIKRLIQIIQTYPYNHGATAPQILIVSPPHCSNTETGGPVQGRSIEESRAFAPLYKAAAAEAKTHFFDAASIVQPSRIDGVHLDLQSTITLGKALAAPVREILKFPGQLIR